MLERLHTDLCLRAYGGKPFLVQVQTLTRYREASSFYYKAVVDAFLTAENRIELVRTESEKLEEGLLGKCSSTLNIKLRTVLQLSR